MAELIPRDSNGNPLLPYERERQKMPLPGPMKPLKDELRDALYGFVEFNAGGLGAKPENVRAGMESIGLGPSSRYGEDSSNGALNPSSIKTFSFSKIFGSTSHESSDVFQAAKLEAVSKSGRLGEELLRILGVRKINDKYTKGSTTILVPSGSPHPQGEMLDKIALNRSVDPSNVPLENLPSAWINKVHGGMLPDKGTNKPIIALSNGTDAVRHEHIHNQIQSLAVIDRDAPKAYYAHAWEKAPDELKEMFGTASPIEFISNMSDMLMDRKGYSKTNAGVNTRRFGDSLPAVRKYYTDLSKEAATLTEVDINRMANEWRKKMKEK
jgi:hypothetical protein